MLTSTWGIRCSGRRVACISSPVTRRFQQTLPTYSARNAIIGSTRLALRAGIQHARNAMTTKSKATNVKVIGSDVLTPYSRLFIMRAPPKAMTIPHNAPIAARNIPCFRISFCTSESCAPSAMRKPISRVRPATTCDITP